MTRATKHHKSPTQLDGHETRGKTARNRLRRVDLLAMRYDPSLIRRRDGAFAAAQFVDVGYGAYPFTVLESGERLRQLNPQLPILGVEIDAARVAEGRPYADGLTDFRVGGFNLPLQPRETVRLIRAFNVLRQYEEAAVLSAHQQMADYLLPSGLLIEGTSNPFGQIWVANLIRRTIEGAFYEALVFSTNFRLGFDPADFQPVLPKNFIHRMVAEEEIELFMQAWKRAFRQTLPYRQWGVRHQFCAAAHSLAEMGYAINCQKKWLNRGFLIWKRDEPLWKS